MDLYVITEWTDEEGKLMITNDGYNAYVLYKEVVEENLILLID